MLDPQLLSEALAITSPVFLIVAAGYLAVRSGCFPAAHGRALSAFAARVAVPAMILKAIAERPLAELFNGPFVVAYALGSLGCFALVALVLRARGRDAAHSAIGALGASLSNTIMVGYPITTALFGAAALSPLALALLVENALIIPLCLLLASGGDGWRGALRTLANPLMVALVAGVLIAASGLALPATLSNSLDLLARAVTGVALFAVGAMLVGLRARELLPEASGIAAAKLLLHPLAVALAMLWVPGVPPAMAGVAIIIAACPMFGIYPVIGELYGQGARCAAALLLATSLAFVSLTAVIAMTAPSPVSP